MDRRTIILAAIATATTVPALAQSTAAGSPSPTGAAPQPPLGDAEKTHAEKTAMIGGASLQMAEIALQKASHPRVKEFAKFEHDEQTTVAGILKSMDPSLAPPPPPADVSAALDQLKKLSAGPAFDREFVSAQITGHEALRTIQQDYLKTGQDAATVDTTKLVLGMIEEHLTLLSDLNKDRLMAL